MYGDTSAPQLLQTRYRSGPLDMRLRSRIRRRRPAAGGLCKLRCGGGDDVLQQLGEVAVRLVDLALPIRPVPALQEVGHALELTLCAEVLGVLAQPVVKPLRECLGAHPLA